MAKDKKAHGLATKLVSTSQKQIEACVKFKKPRLTDISKNIDLYNNKTKKALKGRWNVPLPIMGGFVDTLLSKTDEPASINFGHKDKADYKRALKVTAAWETESSPNNGNWNKIDRGSKKQAILSGLGLYKFHAESDPKYRSILEVPDIFDFIFEPNGGNILEDHLFTGELNIFKTIADLRAGAKTGLYDNNQVQKLLKWEDEDKESDEDDEEKSRFDSLGLDAKSNNYVGQTIYPLAEMEMVWNGIRYYLLYDRKSGIWVRCERLTEVFESDLYPYTAWQTHEDSFNLLSKATADDIRPVAEGMVILFNQMLDNIEKRNWGQKIINPSMFNDLSEFNWRPNGLIKTKAGNQKPLGDGIYEFKVDDNSTVTVNLITFLESFLGQKVGATTGAQGQSEKDKKVGVFFGELQQVADRIGLNSKSYTEAQAGLGLRYYHGLQEHMGEELMIKVIGSKGAEWDKMKKEDIVDFINDPDIFITSGTAQQEQDLVMREGKAKSLTIALNMGLGNRLNPDWTLENVMKTGGWEDEDIKRGMDIENFGNEEVIAEADQAIQDILLGKDTEIYRGMNIAGLQYMLDYSTDTKDLEPEVIQAIREYVQDHVMIAQENSKRAMGQVAQQATDPQAGGAPPQSAETPAPTNSLIPPNVKQAIPAA